MAKGRKTGGRTKGTPNRTTAAMRESWLQAFDALGGSDGLTRWAKRNPDRFYGLAFRLVPPAVCQTCEHAERVANAERAHLKFSRMTDAQLEAEARRLGIDIDEPDGAPAPR
jgi:hypothetical protein